MPTTGFTRPTLADLRTEGRADAARRLGLGGLLPRSVLGVLADVLAAHAHGLHGHLAFLNRQLLPDTASTSYLDRWAAVFGVARKAATPATGSVTFAGNDGASIAVGTLVRRADGEEYSTDAAAVIASGTATVAVTAIVAGNSGDADAGTALVLGSPIPGVDSGVIVAVPGLSGGAGEESDQALRARLLARIRDVPQGGAASDYVAWALEVAGVTRAWARGGHSGAGTVGVFFTVDQDPDGPIPDATQVASVQAYIDPLRPVTAAVTAYAPAPVSLNPEISVTPDTGAVRQAVEASIEDLLLREAEPGGTLLLTHVAEAIATAAGEVDHTVLQLAGAAPDDVTVQAGELLVLGTITWS